MQEPSHFRTTPRVAMPSGKLLEHYFHLHKQFDSANYPEQLPPDFEIPIKSLERKYLNYIFIFPNFSICKQNKIYSWLQLRWEVDVTSVAGYSTTTYIIQLGRIPSYFNKFAIMCKLFVCEIMWVFHRAANFAILPRDEHFCWVSLPLRFIRCRRGASWSRRSGASHAPGILVEFYKLWMCRRRQRPWQRRAHVTNYAPYARGAWSGPEVTVGLANNGFVFALFRSARLGGSPCTFFFYKHVIVGPGIFI